MKHKRKKKYSNAGRGKQGRGRVGRAKGINGTNARRG